jgi:hypothetical protein
LFLTGLCSVILCAGAVKSTRRGRAATVARAVEVFPNANYWRAFALTMLLNWSGNGDRDPAVPPLLRGSFMSFNAALQQLFGGRGSFVASLIVVTRANGELDRFGAVGGCRCSRLWSPLLSRCTSIPQSPAAR